MKEGVIVSLFRYPQKKMPPILEDTLVVKENYGIEGDCHADGGDRQISLLTTEEKEWMEAQETKGFCFRKYKENLLLDGIRMENCHAGDLLVCGDVILELTESIKSCHADLCSLAKSDEKCILAGGSMFARVQKGGVLKSGMKVRQVPGNER